MSIILPAKLARLLYLSTADRTESESQAIIGRFADAVSRRFGAGVLNKVIDQLPKQADLAEGKEELFIETARELEPETLNDLIRTMGLEPEGVAVTADVNPELIGGFRIRRADTLIDGSIKRKINKLRQPAN